MIPGLFRKLPIPERLPAGMGRQIRLLQKAKTKEACLRQTFLIITSRFEGRIRETYTKFWRAWQTDVGKLWARRGFLHCHHLNYLLRILLIRSGKFSEADIRQRLTAIKISPHQYLRINVGTARKARWLDADPWAAKPLGYPVGRHAGY